MATHDTTSDIVYHNNSSLTIPGLSLSYDGGQVLFQNNENITIRHGIVTCIVGVNGAGKISLARIIASKDLPGFPKQLVIEYIAASVDEELLAAYAASESEHTKSETDRVY